MWRIDYYEERNGNQPVADWLDSLDKKTSGYIQDKIVRLQQNGLMLLNTNMMKPLKGCGTDFYELKYGNYRIALYYEIISNTFILLHGFKKERKQSENK